MNQLFSNSNKRKDILRFHMLKYAEGNNVYIASAFFSYSEFLMKILEKDCYVKLIVRLNKGTNGHKLREIISNPNIEIRYYTSENFHPKLYIFEGEIAIVGSSNLTYNGLSENQEINIAVPVDDPRYDELFTIFQEYWEYAEILDKGILNEFINILEEENVYSHDKRVSEAIKKKFKKVDFPNIDKDMPKKTQKESFASSFKKKYQTFLNKYKELEDIYTQNTTAFEEKYKIPIRIYIDQLLSWIREEKAPGETYIRDRISDKEILTGRIKVAIEEFHNEDRDLSGIEEAYMKLNQLLKDDKIQTLTNDEIKQVVTTLHSFSGRSRYYGNMKEMIRQFFDENGIEKIRSSFYFLLYGKGGHVDRIASYLYDLKYRIRHFGESNAKELYGWVNQENIPICNQRTLKSMQWLGFGKL